MFENVHVQNKDATPIDVSGFEYMDLNIDCLSDKLRLLLSYRSPEFIDCLHTLNKALYWTVVYGDFNIHVKNDTDNFANNFRECLDSQFKEPDKLPNNKFKSYIRFSDLRCLQENSITHTC